MVEFQWPSINHRQNHKIFIIFSYKSWIRSFQCTCYRMGPPRSRKGIHSAKKKFNRKYVLSTKHHARDIDQVYDDLAKRQRVAGDDNDNEEKKEPQVFDEDLPAGGQFYCVETARYFMSQDALEKHKKSKQYKQRVKELLKEAVYNQESAEAALGVTKERLPSMRSDMQMSG